MSDKKQGKLESFFGKTIRIEQKSSENERGTVSPVVAAVVVAVVVTVVVTVATLSKEL